MTRPIEDATIRRLREALGRLSIRSSVVAANLANVETPGYRALRAEFPPLLESARRLELSPGGPSHLGSPDGDPRSRVLLAEAPATRIRADGNTVDLDLEMTLLASLQGRYGAAAQMVRKRFALLRYAVTDGRG